MNETGQRKDDHLRINLKGDVQSSLTSGFEHYRFQHCALPELDLDTIDLSQQFLGKRLKLPLLISSMTGGTEQGARINHTLAEHAQAYGLAMGVGSQRAVLENPASVGTFQVRRFAPDILLLANVGAVQLNYGLGVDDCRRLVEMIDADGLILHLNPLQEALQPDGDTNFSGLLKKIENVCRMLAMPVVIKEVGWGIRADLARRLKDCGVSAIDVAGAGGTSWSQVEMHRIDDLVWRDVAAAFRDWGIPTARCLVEINRERLGLPLIASGGIRDGIEVAKALALGAHLAGLAGPYLRAVAQDDKALAMITETIAGQLRVAMFGIGTANLSQLRATRMLMRDECC